VSGQSRRNLREGIELIRCADELLSMTAEWNQLAERAASPFLTAEWLVTWWSAFYRKPLGLVARDGPGKIAFGVC
jgi:CelD/BcsL family acetyltransferase involved in cellulose biosynthesis